MLFSRVSLAFAGLVALAFGNAPDVSDTELEAMLDGSKNVFAMFYAPWCGHCKKFKPDYDLIAKSFADEPSVEIVKVDATEFDSVKEKYGVSGFPTLKFWKKGATEFSDFKAARTLEGVVGFINEKTGMSVKAYEAPQLVIIGTEDNAAETVKNAEKFRLVEFYAPWCGHCKSLAPTYDQLGAAFELEDSVDIIKVDATENEDLAAEFGVSGYPTLKWFAKGSTDAIDYKGGRSLQDFVDYINTNAGTHRGTDGKTKRSAGRWPALDRLAKQFFTSAEAERSAIVDSIEAAAGDFSDAEKQRYVKAANKITAKGNEWVAKEITRLGKIATSDSITDKRREGFFARRNVLQGFLDGEETVEAAKPKEEL